MKQHGESGVEPESATDAKAAPATHSVVVQYVSQSFYEAPSFPRGLVMQPCRRGHVPLLQVLGLPTTGKAQRSVLRLATQVKKSAGWISCFELPDIGDFAFDHLALAMVETSDPASARLAVAVALWLSRLGSTWVVRRKADGPWSQWEINGDQENIVGWSCPVMPAEILAAWARGQRAMVVHLRMDQSPLAYVFEPSHREQLECGDSERIAGDLGARR